jgi:hypothetical protein
MDRTISNLSEKQKAIYLILDSHTTDGLRKAYSNSICRDQKDIRDILKIYENGNIAYTDFLHEFYERMQPIKEFYYLLNANVNHGDIGHLYEFFPVDIFYVRFLEHLTGERLWNTLTYMEENKKEVRRIREMLDEMMKDDPREWKLPQTPR